MEKIQQLALLLKEVQSEKRSSYLPEHYCVDLIKMARDKNLLTVLHSLDGKEYITIAKLKKEIVERSSDNGGRIALSELSQILNMDFGIIKKYTLEICSENSNFIILNDEFISITYIDRIVSEMQDILDANGHLSYSEIHKKFSIPIEFMHKITKERSGQTFHGNPSKLFNGSFITDFEYNRMRAKIFGFILAVKSPVSITAISKSLDFQESYVTTNLKDLVESHPALGVLRLNVFFPLNSSKNIDNFLINEMDRKGIIVYKSLKFLPIDPQTLLKDIFKSNKKDYFYYSKVVVNKEFMENITSKITQVIDSFEVLNTNNLFEECFNDSDSLQIIDFCIQNSKLNMDSLIYIQNKSIIFSNKLVSSIYEKILEFAKEQTFQKLCCDPNFHKQLLKVKNEIQLNEDTSAKKRLNQKYTKDFIHQYFPMKMFSEVMDPSFEFSASEEILSRAYNNFTNTSLPAILDVMHKFSTETGQTLTVSVGESNKERIQNLVKNVTSRFNLMILYVKSASIFEQDLNEKIVQNIVKAIGTGVCENLLRIYIYRISKKLQLSESDLQSLQSDEPLSINGRNSLLQLITDQTQNKSFSLIFQSLKNYNEFTKSIMAVKERSICDVPLNLNLKKKEIKSAIDIHITYQIKVLEKYLSTNNPTISDASAAFQSCVSLMLSKYCDQHLIFPPKFISDIIYKFSNFIDPSTRDMLHQIKGSVVQLLSCKTSEEKPLPESLLASITALCNQSKQLTFPQ